VLRGCDGRVVIGGSHSRHAVVDELTSKKQGWSARRGVGRLELSNTVCGGNLSGL